MPHKHIQPILSNMYETCIHVFVFLSKWSRETNTDILQNQILLCKRSNSYLQLQEWSKQNKNNGTLFIFNKISNIISNYFLPCINSYDIHDQNISGICIWLYDWSLRSEGRRELFPTTYNPRLLSHHGSVTRDTLPSEGRRELFPVASDLSPHGI